MSSLPVEVVAVVFMESCCPPCMPCSCLRRLDEQLKSLWQIVHRNGESMGILPLSVGLNLLVVFNSWTTLSCRLRVKNEENLLWQTLQSRFRGTGADAVVSSSILLFPKIGCFTMFTNVMISWLLMGFVWLHLVNLKPLQCISASDKCYIISSNTSHYIVCSCYPSWNRPLRDFTRVLWFTASSQLFA